jgi:hypothetical protein
MWCNEVEIALFSRWGCFGLRMVWKGSELASLTHVDVASTRFEVEMGMNGHGHGWILCLLEIRIS